MSREKPFLANIMDERIAYRLVLSFALMSIVPMLITTYILVVMWLPDLALWARISVLFLLGLSVAILGFLLSRTIVYTVLRTSQAAKEIADGDLTKRIEIRNKRSELSLLAQSFNEITTRLQQKINELETSEKKYRHLVENVPDLLYYLDPAGNITSVNEEVTELLGYSKEDLLNLPFSQIVHADDYKQNERVLRERRQDETRLTKGLRIRLRTLDGIFRTFEINSRGVYDAEGDFLGTEGLARDISAQIALEVEREEFLYMLTHDIKNPVSAILFIVYMLRDGTLPPSKYSDSYDKIERACNGVVRLVEDFLEFKKLESGNVHLEKRKVNLCQMIEDIARTYSSEAEANGKKITTNLEQCEDPVLGKRAVVEVDESYFSTVLENLLTNAIKFARTRIEIGLRDKEKDFILYVRDDGPGVSEKEKEDIFRIFHTCSGARMVKGIGIGLASAQKIVRAHGGSLWVESEPRNGCSFMVSIPRPVGPKETISAAKPLSDSNLSESLGTA
ncbi:MAG: PAS domain S-box protein [Candidatus Lindowbacteria bacterium]|nr:PAS domain S-box protein [Candidatus Lindowbacteria bacterium]